MTRVAIPREIWVSDGFKGHDLAKVMTQLGPSQVMTVEPRPGNCNPKMQQWLLLLYPQLLLLPAWPHSEQAAGQSGSSKALARRLLLILAPPPPAIEDP